MPVMDGLTAIGEIRERERRGGRPRTADLRAHRQRHARARPRRQAAGADGHLTKPITADALFAIVEAAGRRLAEGPVPAARRA